MFYYILFSLYLLYIVMYIYKVNIKIIGFIIAFTIPIPAFFFDPVNVALHTNKDPDTIRIFYEMERMRATGWDTLTTHDGVVLSKAYIYFFSQFDCDQLLPVVTCFLGYGLYIYALIAIGKRLEMKDSIIRFAILGYTLSASYFGYMTNIRFPLAIVLVCIFMSYELLINRYTIISKIISFFMVFMHPGSLLVIMVRCFASIKYKYAVILFLSIILLSWLNLNEIINILITFDSDTLLTIANKMESYSSKESGFSMFSEVTFMISNFLIIIICLYVDKYVIIKGYRRIVRICIWSAVISIILYGINLILPLAVMRRCAVIYCDLIFMIPYILSLIMKNTEVKTCDKKVVSICMWFFVILNYIYNMGHLYGYII